MDGTALDPTIPQLDGVTHRFVDLPGLRMHVAEAGHGHPLLLLHGFPQHWWEYRKVIPPLAEHYRVICPDLRGAGWTSAPATGYNRDQFLADLVNLLDALGLARVHLVAHDWAAMVGFHLCLTDPERVTGYIAMGIPHPYLRFHPRMLPRMRHAWYQLAIVPPGIGARFLGRGRQRLPRYLLRRYSSTPGAFSDEDLELFLRPLRDPARARAGSALYRRFIAPEGMRMVRGLYRDSRLTTPTLVLTGAEDPVVRAEFLGGFDGHAADMTVAAIDGASHFIVDDRPDLVVERTLAFFADR